MILMWFVNSACAECFCQRVWALCDFVSPARWVISPKSFSECSWVTEWIKLLFTAVFKLQLRLSNDEEGQGLNSLVLFRNQTAGLQARSLDHHWSPYVFIVSQGEYTGEIKGGLRPSMKLVVMGIINQKPKRLVRQTH